MSTDDLYRQLVEGTSEGIIVAGRDGMVRLWNRGAEKIFGHTATEAVAQSLDLIIPENLRERHWQGFSKVMNTGVTRYADDVLSVPALHKSGERISCEFTVTLIRDGSGKVSGVAAFMRDVTARWQRESELRKQLERLQKQAEQENESSTVKQDGA